MSGFLLFWLIIYFLKRMKAEKTATEIALPSCVAVFFCSSLRIHKMTF